MPPRKQRLLKRNPETVVHQDFFQQQQQQQQQLHAAPSLEPSTPAQAPEQPMMPLLGQLNLDGSSGPSTSSVAPTTTAASSMLFGAVNAGADDLPQHQPESAPIMVSDEDVQSISTRSTQRIRALWKIMCSTIDIIHNPSGAAQIGCQDPALFHACAYQHQRLSGENNLRRPENFFLHRQIECPFQCPPNSVGCNACLRMKFVLDDWCDCD
jgi:hypothetical protein